MEETIFQGSAEDVYEIKDFFTVTEWEAIINKICVFMEYDYYHKMERFQ